VSRFNFADVMAEVDGQDVRPRTPAHGTAHSFDALMAEVDGATTGLSPGSSPGIVPAGMPGMAPTIPVGGVSRVPSPAQGIVGDIGVGLAAGTGQAVSQVGGAMEAVGNILPGALGRRVQRAGAETVQMGVDDTTQFPQPTTFAGQIAQSVPGLAAAIGAGAVTGGIGGLAVGAGMAGAQSGGQQYNDAKARVLAAGGTVDQARQVATNEAGPMALFSAATSVIPMGRYLGRFSPAVLNRAVGKVSQRPLFRILGDAAAEGSQEAAEELASMTLQTIAEDDPEAFRDWGTRLATAGAGGAILGGGVGGGLDIAGRIGGTRGVQDAQPAAPSPVPAPNQGAGVAPAPVAPPGVVGPVATDVPGGGGVVPPASPVSVLSDPNATEEQVLAALAELDEGVPTPDATQSPAPVVQATPEPQADPAPEADPEVPFVAASQNPTAPSPTTPGVKQPWEMTAQEHGAHLIQRDGIDPKYVVSISENGSLVMLKGAPKAQTRRGARGSIKDGINNRGNINAALLDAVNRNTDHPLTLPDGYVREGDYYVYRGTDAPPTPRSAAPVVQATPEPQADPAPEADPEVPFVAASQNPTAPSPTTPGAKQPWEMTDVSDADVIAEAKRQGTLRLPREGETAEQAVRFGASHAKAVSDTAKEFGGYVLVEVPVDSLVVRRRDIDASRQQRLTAIGGSRDPIFIEGGIYENGKPVLVVENGNNRVEYAKQNKTPTISAYIPKDHYAKYVSSAPAVTGGTQSEPTSLAGWKAEASRLGVSPQGPLPIVRARVRKSRLESAQARNASRTSDSQPAADYTSSPSADSIGDDIAGTQPQSDALTAQTTTDSASPTVLTRPQLVAEARRLGLDVRGSAKVLRERIVGAQTASRGTPPESGRPTADAPAVPAVAEVPSSATGTGLSSEQIVPPAGREVWEMTREEFSGAATDKTNREDYARAWTPVSQRGQPNTVEFVPYSDGKGGVVRWNDERGIGRGVIAFSDGKVTELAVQKEWRRKGIATALYREAAKRGATESKGSITPAAMSVRHKAIVDQAIRDGKPVPASVLADYPDLAAEAHALAAKVSPEQSRSGGSRSRGQTKPATPDTPRPASPGVERGSTSVREGTARVPEITTKPWRGETLYAWNNLNVLVLKKGRKLPSVNKSGKGARTRSMPAQWRDQFTTVPTDATRLVEWIKARTPEVWKLEGSRGQGHTLVPKHLVNQAKSAVPDWNSDVEAATARKQARRDLIAANRDRRAALDIGRNMTSDEWDELAARDPEGFAKLAAIIDGEAKRVPDFDPDELNALAAESAGDSGGDQVPDGQGDAEGQGGADGGGSVVAGPAWLRNRPKPKPGGKQVDIPVGDGKPDVPPRGSVSAENQFKAAANDNPGIFGQDASVGIGDQYSMFVGGRKPSHVGDTHKGAPEPARPRGDMQGDDETDAAYRKRMGEGDTGTLPGMNPPPRKGDAPKEAKRSRPVSGVVFDKPIKGPSGAELLGYEWSWKMEEQNDREGELVERRVSDWDESLTNEDTGREIVHKFSVRSGGAIETVSLETALKQLGYLDATSSKPLRNIASSLKTLATRKMQLARAESELAPLMLIDNAVNALPLPVDKINIVLRDPWSDQAKARGERRIVWEMDGVDVAGGTLEASANPPNTIPSERKQTLEWLWRDAEKARRGLKPYALTKIKNEIHDHKRWIERLERKLGVSGVDGSNKTPPKSGGSNPRRRGAAPTSPQLAGGSSSDSVPKGGVPSTLAATDSSRQTKSGPYTQDTGTSREVRAKGLQQTDTSKNSAGTGASSEYNRRRGAVVIPGGDSQKRAKPGGELGPNGEWYPGGAFIATTELPKMERAKVERAKTGRVQVDAKTYAVPEPGKMSILDKLGGTFMGLDGRFNETFAARQIEDGVPESYVNTARSLAEKYRGGERWFSVNEHPEFAGPNEAYRLLSANQPVPGALLDKLHPDVRASLQKYQSGGGYNRRRGAAITPAAFGQPKKQTDTPQFKAWFGNSKVVDAKGQPLVVYHGTASDFDVFNPGKRNQLGAGMYFTDNTKLAGVYAKEAGDSQAIMPVFLSMSNPLVIRNEAHNWEREHTKMVRKLGLPAIYTGEQVTAALRSKGYDGLIQIADTSSGNNGAATTYMVLDPTQIKSATGNSGAFSKHDPRISGHAINPIEETLDIARRVSAKRAANRARDLAKIEQRGADNAKAEAERLQKGKESAELTAKAYQQRVRDQQRASRQMVGIEQRGAEQTSRRLVKAETQLEEAGIAIEGMKAKLRATIAENAKDKNLREIMRARVTELAKDYLPADLQGRMLVPVRDAKNAADVFRAIFKIEDVLLDRAQRNTVRLFKATSSTGMLKKLTDARRTQAKGIIAAAQADVEAIGKQGATADERRTALEALREKVQQLQTIYHEHRFENKIRVKGQWVDLAQKVRQLGLNLTFTAKRRGRDRRRPERLDNGIWQKTQNAGRTVLTPETAMMRLDGEFNTGDVATDIGYTQLADANLAFRDEHGEYLNALDQLAMDLGFDGVTDVLSRLGGRLGDATREKIDFKVQGVPLSLGQALDLYAASLDPETGALIPKGQRWAFRDGDEPFDLTPAQVSEIIGQIDDRYLQFHQRANGMLEAHFPDIQKAHWTIKGYEPPGVPNHWPRRRDTTQIPVDAKQNPAAEVDFYMENAGGLKTRKQSPNVPLFVDDYATTLMQKAEFTFRAKHLMVPLYNARRLLEAPEVTTAIRTRFGKNMVDNIHEYMQDVAGVRRLSPWQETLAQWTRNYSRSLTQISPSSWAIQLSGIPRIAMERGGTEIVAKGIGGAFSPGTHRDMVQNSSWARTRYKTDPGALSGGLAQNTQQTASNARTAARAGWKSAKAAASSAASLKLRDAGAHSWDVLDKSIAALTDKVQVSQWFDGVVSRVAWSGLRSIATANGHDTAWVDKQHRTLMRRIANSGEPTEMAFWAAEVNRKGLTPLTAFTSDASKAAAQVYRAMHGTKADKARALSGLLASAAFAGVMKGLWEAGMGALRDDEDAEDKAYAKAVDRMTDELASLVPFADKVKDMVAGTARFNQRLIDAPLIGGIENATRSVARIANEGRKLAEGSDEADMDKALDAAFDLLIEIVRTRGIPTTPVTDVRRMMATP
jgi:GNAT superfamily N-acetyltransferase